MKEKNRFSISSFALHIIAMVFMFCDHLWGTIIPGNGWLTCIGRIAFPIFAFLIVEGYFHTSNLKKYVLRLLIFALISEIPYNLVKVGYWIDPFEQNVLWTFLIAIWMIYLNEKAKKTNKLWIRILVATCTLILGPILGIATFADYNSAGVLTVLMFYFLRGRKWWNFLGQFIVLAYINIEMMKGLNYEVPFGGNLIEVSQQSFAILALIPIWLYNGKQGLYNKFIKYGYYIFYPLHLLILGLINYII